AHVLLLERVKDVWIRAVETDVRLPSGVPVRFPLASFRKDFFDLLSCPLTVEQDQPGQPLAIDRSDRKRGVGSYVEMEVQNSTHVRQGLENAVLERIRQKVACSCYPQCILDDCRERHPPNTI